MSRRSVGQRSGDPRKGALGQDVLDDIVRRVVEIAEPERIILFGSAAREEMGPHSDVDLLIVKANVHRRRLAGDITRISTASERL